MPLDAPFFFEADDSILIGGGRLGSGNKFVEPLPVSSIFFCLNVFVATANNSAHDFLLYYYFKPEYRIIIIIIIIFYDFTLSFPYFPL